MGKQESGERKREERMQELWRSKCGAVRAKRKKEKGGKMF